MDRIDIHPVMQRSYCVKAGDDDLQELVDLGKTTFLEAFMPSSHPAYVQEYADNAFTIQRQEQELANPDTEFYFARLDGQTIGYMKLNFSLAQTEFQDHRAMEIERLYIKKEFQGNKAGQLLIDQALQIAEAWQLEYIWLGVWELNPHAIRFYSRNGFVQFSTHIFRIGDEDQTDHLMKRYLSPEHGSGL